MDDTELTKAETSRAAVLLTAVAKAAIAKLKREADMGWHYTKLYRYIDEIIGKTITSECAKILAAAKTKPLQFSAEAKARAALTDLELKVVVKKIGVKKVKAVTNIAPKVGTKVKRGSTVTITVG